MARRKQSYFAASNRNKAGSVFWNNCLADAAAETKKREREREKLKRLQEREQEKQARQRQKEQEKEEKQASQRQKEQEKRARQRQKEQEKRARQRQKEEERQKKIEAKEQAKLEKLITKTALLCEKHHISEMMIHDIAERALKADVTPSKTEKDVILPKLRFWQVEGVLKPFEDTEEFEMDDFLKFKAKMCDSNTPHDEIMSLPEVKDMKDRKLILDEIERLEDDELITEENLTVLKKAENRGLSLETFRASHDVERLIKEKQRHDILEKIADEEIILEDDLKEFSNYILSNKIPAEEIRQQDKFYALQVRKERSDNTNAQLQSIFEEYELHIEEFGQLKEYVQERFMEIKDIKSLEQFKKFKDIKQKDLRKLEELENKYSLNNLKLDSKNTSAKETPSYLKNLESIKLVNAGNYYFQMLWRFLLLGCLGVHRIYSGRTLSGISMLLLLILSIGAISDISLIKELTLPISKFFNLELPEQIWLYPLLIWLVVDFFLVLFGRLKNKHKNRAII